MDPRKVYLPEALPTKSDIIKKQTIGRALRDDKQSDDFGVDIKFIDNTRGYSDFIGKLYKKETELYRIRTEMKILANYNPKGINEKEKNHMAADQLLCDLLILLDFEDIVNDFDSLDKKYA